MHKDLMDLTTTVTRMGAEGAGAWGFAHTKPYDRDRITPVRNRHFVKPAGGIWLSPYHGQGDCEWGRWLASEGEGLFEGETLMVQRAELSDGDVLRIHTMEDLERVYSVFPALDMDDLFTTMAWCYLDFEAISRHYVGLWLTEEGQWATRYSRDRQELIGGLNLYGWDLETLLLFDKTMVRAMGDREPMVNKPLANLR